MTTQEAQAILTQSEVDRTSDISNDSTLVTNRKASLLTFFRDIWPIFQVINNNLTIGTKPALFGDAGTTVQVKNQLENQIENKATCGFITSLTNKLELKVRFYVNDELISFVRVGLKTPNFESSKDYTNVIEAADRVSDIIVKYKD